MKMAINKTLHGPRPVAYFTKYWARLEWKPVPVPKPYTEHWAILYKGQHVGELFKGKSGMWYGIIFGRLTMWRKVQRWVLLTLAACIIGPQN